MQVTIEVAKETYELGEGVAGFVAELKTALADGWQPGQDIPVMLTAALTKLVPAVQGVEQIPAELKQTQEFAAAVALTGAMLVSVFV